MARWSALVGIMERLCGTLMQDLIFTEAQGLVMVRVLDTLAFCGGIEVSNTRNATSNTVPTAAAVFTQP